MKWYKKLLWWCVGIVATLVLGVSIYGMGSNLIGVFPAWLTASIIGLVVLILEAIIASIFAMGIIKIREIFKDN